MPMYPSYVSSPFTGNLPPNREMGPPDLFPSSSVAPAYQRRFDRMFGRQLAGDEQNDTTSNAKVPGAVEEPAWALNELRYFEELDDTQGSGIFEAPGSRPNNYADAGIFSQSYSHPGYLAREKPWAKSEVVDATTGRQVVYVPGGSVAMDSAAQAAFIENMKYGRMNPVMTPYQERGVPYDSTVNVKVNPEPVGAEGDPLLPPSPKSGVGGFLLAAGLVGLAAGVVYAVTKKKGK